MPRNVLTLDDDELQWLAARLGKVAALDLANTGGANAVVQRLWKKVRRARDEQGRPPVRLLADVLPMVLPLPGVPS